MSGQRIMDIEVLRVVAVLGVLFQQLQGYLFTDTVPLLKSIEAWGQPWWGVDLFFAISGFVIARSLIPVLQGCCTRQNFWEQTHNIWLRRAFRLLPSAWLWLALMLLACLFLNRSGAFGTLHANLQAMLAGVLQYANFRFADSFFHYEYGSSFVYWSLSLEEQFYLLFPLLIYVCRKHLVWVLLGLVAVQLFLLRTPLLMSIRTDALALGVLLAIASVQPAYRHWEPRFLRRPWAGVSSLIVFALLASFMATGRFSEAHYRVGSPVLTLLIASGLIVLLSELNFRFIEMPTRSRGAALVKNLGTSRPAAPSPGATSC